MVQSGIATRSRPGGRCGCNRRNGTSCISGPAQVIFLASFILGEKAVAAARKSKLPARILKMIDEAKRYAEGTAVRLEVHDVADASVVKTLAKIKFEN